jgi:hypothetical protein
MRSFLSLRNWYLQHIFQAVLEVKRSFRFIFDVSAEHKSVDRMEGRAYFG